MNIIYGLIVLSVTSSLLIIVWPMIFVVGGIFLLLIIWTLVDKWLNPSKNISSHVNNPKASIEKFTPQPAVEFKSELTEILGMDSEFANLLYNSYWEINTVENLANLGTNELISIKKMTTLEAEKIIISAIRHLDIDDNILKILEVEDYKDETNVNVIISEISETKSTLGIMLEFPTDTRPFKVIMYLLDTIDELIDKGCELTGMTQEEFIQMANNKNPNSNYE